MIGAAKSGTTTLYDLIKDHPELSVPKAKEAPFFSNDSVYKNGIDWYLKVNFSHASEGQLRGTLTPQYMIGQGDVTPQVIAQRIRHDAPDAKIIAILRDPIERAFSHYRMLRRNGHERRNFDEAVNDILSGQTQLPNYEDPDCNYIMGSEYGKILEHYYKLFPKEHILILTTKQLKNNPDGVLEALFGFLGVDKTYRPQNLHQESRKGGGKARVKFLTPGFLYSIPLVKITWRHVVPQPVRKRVEYSINLWNTVPDNEKLDKDSSTYKKLVRYFAKDEKRLNKYTDFRMPWSYGK